MIQQAIFEVDELRAAIEYGMEGMADAVKFIDQLEHHVKPLYKSMEDSTLRICR